MDVFLNECSLHGQYENKYEFKNSLENFLKVISFLDKSNFKKFYKSNFLFYRNAEFKKNLGTSLKETGDLKQSFVLNFQRLNPKPWEDERIHSDNCSYQFREEDFCNTSVAELAERNLNLEKICGFLVNFHPSNFDHSPIIILKNEKKEIEIDSFHSIFEIEKWIKANPPDGEMVPYDESSGISPQDNQTVLFNSQVFELTNYPNNNGRKVYRRIGTKELWVVDGSNFHAGARAHIEVFDEVTRNHLGTSIYNEIALSSEFTKKARKIDLG